MKEPMKNIAKGEALILKEQVDYQPGQVVSKTLAQNLRQGGGDQHPPVRG